MEQTTWHGYRAEKFEFEGRESILVFPDKPREGNPWLLKTEYWGAFPDVEVRLLGEGFHVAFQKNENRWATPEECAVKARFVEHVTDHWGLAPKCVPVGMSCGGGIAVKFAGLYPHLIQCLFIDAPVINFCSIPGKLHTPHYRMMWDNEFSKVYPLKRYQLPGFDGHPICYADTLIAHKIPVLMVYGTEDQTVLYPENGKLLEEAMEGTGLLTVIPVPARGHHPHGMIYANDPIVQYILDHC